MKRLLSITIAAFMLLGLMPAAFAAGTRGVINRIALDDVTVAPPIGGKVTDSCGYTLPGTQYINVEMVGWYDSTTHRHLADDDVFAEGHLYSIGFSIVTTDGYTFSPELIIAVNEREDLVDWGSSTVYSTSLDFWTVDTESVASSVEPTISDVKLADVTTVPEAGKTASDFGGVNVPDDAHYRVAMFDWVNTTDDEIMLATDEFDANSFYCIRIVVAADAGFTFTKDTTVTINGSSSVIETISPEPSYGALWIYTKETKAQGGSSGTVIDTVEINDITAVPVPGEKAGDYLDYTIPDGAKYFVECVMWGDADHETELDPNAVFEAGVRYQLIFCLRTSEGYIFDSSTVVEFNGGSVAADYVNSNIALTGREMWIATMPEYAGETDKLPIENVSVYNAETTPVAGGKCGDHLNCQIPVDADYTVKSVRWYNCDTKLFVPEYEYFVLDTTYQIVITLIPNDGYTFKRDTHIEFNGGAEYDPMSGIYPSEDGYVLMVGSVPAKAVEGIPVTGVTLDYTELTMQPKEMHGLYAQVLPENAINRNVIWTSSDESVATVDDHGMVTAVAAGHATVTVTTQEGGFTAECEVTVIGGEAPVTVGDVNDDGKITTSDAVVVLKYSASMITLDEIQMQAGDTNRDGKVNTADAVLILKYAAGMIAEF